jgi:hypothetical protein
MKNTILTSLLTLILFSTTMAQAVVSVPTLNVSPGDTFTVPVLLENADTIFAFQFDLGFEPDIIKPVECSTQGTITEGFAVFCNTLGDIYRVSAFNGYEIEGQGIIVNITFMSGKQGCSVLKFSDQMFFNPDGLIETEGVDGQVCIVQ